MGLGAKTADGPTSRDVVVKTSLSITAAHPEKRVPFSWDAYSAVSLQAASQIGGFGCY
jgi:hypothetical protein